MDAAIVLCILLLVVLTGLLYKLTIALEPRSNGSASVAYGHDASVPSDSSNQQLIHQRLRK